MALQALELKQQSSMGKRLIFRLLKIILTDTMSSLKFYVSLLRLLAEHRHIDAFRKLLLLARQYEKMETVIAFAVHEFKFSVINIINRLINSINQVSNGVKQSINGISRLINCIIWLIIGWGPGQGPGAEGRRHPHPPPFAVPSGPAGPPAIH